MPALDGVRALAVAAVLVFHADLHVGGQGVLPGGFLGVSVFFTLSGFLITSLLVHEQARHGRIALGAFYARRVRRLVPAAYVCVAAVLAMGVLWGATQRRDLPGDAIAAIANVANWRFAFAGRSYQDLFLGLPSPLAHFWSLAIEEQCYLVLPIVVWWSLRRGARRLAVVLATLVAASLVATLLTHDANVVYHGTHTRAAELLVGALAALAFRRWHPPRWVHTALSAAGLAVLVVLVQTVDLRTHWLYRGGFLLVALASAALIVGLAGANPVARVVGARPLVAVGRVSYGIYLYHWPVYLALDPARVGFGGLGLLAVRLTATAIVVVLSHRLVEAPVRAGARWARAGRPFAAMAAGAALLVVAAAVVVPAPHFTPTQQLLAQGTGTPLAFHSATPEVPPPPVPTLLVLGSEAAVATSLQVLPFHVVDGVQPGCPVIPGVEVHFLDGRVLDSSRCEPASTRWTRLLDEVHPDVVVIATGALDTGFSRDATDPALPPIEPSHLGELGAVLGRTEARLVDALAPVLAASPTVLLYDADTVGNGESVLARVSLQSSRPLRFTRSLGELFATASRAMSVDHRPPAPKVLVVGDSTSLDMASALAQGADGRVQVMWAGANGCPFVRAVAARSGPQADWARLHCAPFDTKLPPVLRDFRPDAVLLVVGPMELQELRMPGDPVGHVVGDAPFTTEHDAELAAFRTVIGDVPLLVADSPPIRAGAWASAEMADPARVAAWNALVAHWVTCFPRVRLLPYAAALTTYEAAHGNIRSDGVHPDVGPLTDLARQVLVDAVLQLVR